jgi:hypothetical protein
MGLAFHFLGRDDLLAGESMARMEDADIGCRDERNPIEYVFIDGQAREGDIRAPFQDMLSHLVIVAGSDMDDHMRLMRSKPLQGSWDQVETEDMGRGDAHRVAFDAFQCRDGSGDPFHLHEGGVRVAKQHHGLARRLEPSLVPEK